MSQTHHIDFHGDNLIGVKTDAGIVIPLKPICDAIALDWENERQRIGRHPTLAKGTCIIQVPYGPGGGQRMFCMLLQRLNLWLASVNPNRTHKPESLILYQEEAADVLFAYFMPEVAQALGIKLPTLQARLVQDDLFDRAPVPAQPDPPADVEAVKTAVVEALVSSGIAKRDDIWRAADDLDYKIEKQLKPIKTVIDRTEIHVIGTQCDFWEADKRSPEAIQRMRDERDRRSDAENAALKRENASLKEQLRALLDHARANPVPGVGTPISPNGLHILATPKKEPEDVHGR